MKNTKEQIFQSAIDHYTDYSKMGDDWGFGQINIDTILIMIEVGKKFNLEFTFAKVVTALDDEYEDKTIAACKNHLFVYPSHRCGDFGEFWKLVRKVQKEINYV